jgi:hypothetical protein
MVSRINQLNVPMEAELKEEWKQWARVRGTSLSALIEQLARACVYGEEMALPVEITESDGVGRQEFEELKKKFAELETRLSSQPSQGLEVIRKAARAEQAKERQLAAQNNNQGRAVSEKIHELEAESEPVKSQERRTDSKIAKLEGKTTDVPAVAPVVEVKPKRMDPSNLPILAKCPDQDVPVGPTPTVNSESDKGLTSGKLAEKLGITRSTVEGWESRGQTPPTHTFKRGDRKGEAIAIPPYSCADKKWYPAPQN